MINVPVYLCNELDVSRLERSRGDCRIYTAFMTEICRDMNEKELTSSKVCAHVTTRVSPSGLWFFTLRANPEDSVILCSEPTCAQ